MCPRASISTEDLQSRPSSAFCLCSILAAHSSFCHASFESRPSPPRAPCLSFFARPGSGEAACVTWSLSLSLFSRQPHVFRASFQAHLNFLSVVFAVASCDSVPSFLLFLNVMVASQSLLWPFCIPRCTVGRPLPGFCHLSVGDVPTPQLPTLPTCPASGSISCCFPDLGVPQVPR